MTSSSVQIFPSNSVYSSQIKLPRQLFNLPNNSCIKGIVAEGNYYFPPRPPRKINLLVTSSV